MTLRNTLKSNLNLAEFSTAEKILQLVIEDQNSCSLVRERHINRLNKSFEHIKILRRKNSGLIEINSCEFIFDISEFSKLKTLLAKIIQDTWGENYSLYQKEDDDTKRYVQSKIATALYGYLSTLNNLMRLTDVQVKSGNEFYKKFYGKVSDIAVAKLAIEATKAPNFSEDNLTTTLKPVLQKLLVELIEKDPAYFNSIRSLGQSPSSYLNLLPSDLMQITFCFFSPQNLGRLPHPVDSREKIDISKVAKP